MIADIEFIYKHKYKPLTNWYSVKKYISTIKNKTK